MRDAPRRLKRLAVPRGQWADCCRAPLGCVPARADALDGFATARSRHSCFPYPKYRPWYWGRPASGMKVPDRSRKLECLVRDVAGIVTTSTCERARSPALRRPRSDGCLLDCRASGTSLNPAYTSDATPILQGSDNFHDDLTIGHVLVHRGVRFLEILEREGWSELEL